MTQSESKNGTSRTPSAKRPARRNAARQGKLPRYTVIIQWSNEDRCYVVSLPEWGPYCKTHGDTYEQAARHAREVLEMLIESEAEETTPTPKLFHYPGAAATDLPADAVGVPQHRPAGTAKRRTA